MKMRLILAIPGLLLLGQVWLFASSVPDDATNGQWRIRIAYRIKAPSTGMYQKYEATLHSTGDLVHGDKERLQLHVLPREMRATLSPEETARIYRAVAKVLNTYDLQPPAQCLIPVDLIGWSFELEFAQLRKMAVEDGAMFTPPEAVTNAINLLRLIHKEHQKEQQPQPPVGAYGLPPAAQP